MLLFPRLKMGAALFSAVCCMLFASYVGVILMNWAIPVAYVLMVGGLICLAALLPLIALDHRNLRGRMLSVPFWAYLSLCSLFVFLTYGKMNTGHDDFSFWARAVKELFILNRSYFQAGNNMFHMDYIPMAASLQYCIVRVFGWQDAFLAYVPIACVITGICAMADFLLKKRYGVFFIVIALLYYPALAFEFGQLTADGSLSVVFCSALLCLCYRKDVHASSLLPVICAIAILPGLKIYSGLLFAVLLTVLLLWSVKKERAKPPVEFPKDVACSTGPNRIPMRFAVLACCLMLFTQFSWSGYYHFQSRRMDYENILAQASYENQSLPEDLQVPSLTLRDIFAGNPRTSSLSSALTPEALDQVGDLIGITGTMYQKSYLPAALLFLLPLLWIAWQSNGRDRTVVLTLLFSMLAAGILYTLGLFAGYFVQPEIYGGVITYLSTVHMPVILTALFVCVRSVSLHWDKAGKGAALCLLLSLLALPIVIQASHFPMPRFKPVEMNEGSVYHAKSFWEEEVSALLGEEDQQARAVLMDATWEATDITSKSSITHTYQYFALPMRVSVWQFEWGNYEAAESITRDFLVDAVKASRSNLLILRTDDFMYEDAFALALDVETDADMPWVFDVGRENGEVIFTQRNEDDD